MLGWLHLECLKFQAYRLGKGRLKCWHVSWCVYKPDWCVYVWLVWGNGIWLELSCGMITGVQSGGISVAGCSGGIVFWDLWIFLWMPYINFYLEWKCLLDIWNSSTIIRNLFIAQGTTHKFFKCRPFQKRRYIVCNLNVNLNTKKCMCNGMIESVNQ